MANPAETSFGRAFRISEAVHLLVSTFARSGFPIGAIAAVRSLQAEFPRENLSDDELLTMLRNAAAESRVPISENRH